MNRLVTFVTLDLYSYWYHRFCHKFNVPWHKAHHEEETVDAITEPILSGVLIFSGIKAYEKNETGASGLSKSMFTILVSSISKPLLGSQGRLQSRVAR